MIRKPLVKLSQQQLRSRSSVISPLLKEEKPKIQNVCKDIRGVLDEHLEQKSSLLNPISKYYFDGKGKALRPRFILAMSEAVNSHLGISSKELERRQYEVAMIAEMYHTSSLYHDDVIDKAELRRNRDSVNLKWGQKSSVMAGNYAIATSNILLGQLRDPDVVSIMNRIIEDLVIGELQQLSSNPDDKNDRFQGYLKKSYNKTASLMANSCQAVAQMAVTKDPGNRTEQATSKKSDEARMTIESAYLYGKNLGIAFQLIDDWLDFSSTAEALGKPAAADLKLGLATAPVLFAADEHEELDSLIKRRFSRNGDVQRAFHLVLASNGLEQTQFLAKSYGKAAYQSIKSWKNSEAKQELLTILDEAIQRTK